MTKVFLDTAYFIALVSTADRHHLKAQEISEWIATTKIQTVTTQAVMLEVGNALSKQRYRRIAVSLLSLIESDSDTAIIPLTRKLYVQAFALFSSRLDKEWGLVDCMSCVVIQEQSITQVATADKHFRQMGFKVLLDGS